MKSIQVSDKYRTNPLSLTPGGGTVEVTNNLKNTVLIYDKIKFIKPYLAKVHGNAIARGEISKITQNGVELELSVIKDHAVKKGWVK